MGAPLALGFLLGAGLVLLIILPWTRNRIAAERRAADARAAVAEAVAAERAARATELLSVQRESLEAARMELEHSFRGLAASALEGSNRQFMELAAREFALSREKEKGDLDRHTGEIRSLLDPLAQTLSRLETKTGELEKARETAYGGLREGLDVLNRVATSLQDRTASLATALRGSEARGRWGELALRNAAELAGMSEYCDFTLQEGLPGGRRPDMVVRLPGERSIAVDAKAPLTAYLASIDAVTPEARVEALDRHVRDLRAHVRALAGRGYAAELQGGIDFVVMFLPGDAFVAAAMSHDPTLQEDALRAHVLVATPTTLVALLRTVAIYWQQRSLAENAEQIAQAARELYDRGVNFAEHLGGVGRGLRGAIEAYNQAVGSYHHRLLPMARRLEDLKAAEQARRPLEPPLWVDEVPREVQEPAV